MNEEEKKFPILIEDLGMMFATENSKSKVRFGLYQCPYCENQFKANTYYVNRGSTFNCGCIKKGNNRKHSLTKHRLYATWAGMIDRTTEENYNRYKDYGGRGITVCERWKDVVNFIEDMYPTFEEGLTLDRIDVNGNYEPSNCRWATRSSQSRNTRRIQKNNTSGYRGVSFDKIRNKWRASIRINNKQKNLGNFNTALEAAIAYDKYVIENNLEHTTNGLLD